MSNPEASAARAAIRARDGEAREKLVEQLERYRVRTCRYLNECRLCGQSITAGQRYHDGGYGRRAHEDCIGGQPGS